MKAEQIRLLMEIQAIRQMDVNNRKTRPGPAVFPALLETYLLSQKEQLDARDTNRKIRGTRSSLTESPQTAYLAQPLLNINNQKIKNSGGKIHDIIKEAAEKYRLPVALLHSVIKHESNFNAKAVSSSGARGLMQLMPQTAKSLGVKNIFDPRENIMAGAKYLRKMLDQFGSLELALAAYNAGPGNVKKYNGIPPFKETRKYVAKILKDVYV